MQVIALALALTATSQAVPDLRVLDEARQPRKMLYTYLQGEARKHFDARRAAVAALKTPEALKGRQEELRGKFLASLGVFPERTPLNARVVGRERREGYRVERVLFESRPGHHVTATLYLPEGQPPFPGVLVPCGHSANGKAAEPYQRAAILLARNGMAALCYDPIGQGERVQLLDAKGKPAIPLATAEHTMAGIGALLVGRQAAHYRVWDGIRALDYLASRPEVDPNRLGCTGNSGGGTMTAYLMALDDRVAVAAPSCYITSLERLFATIGPQDAEQDITGQVAFGMEHADYVTMRAPKPTLICVGTRDFFDIDGSWASFREAKLAYGRFGYGERVELFESDEPHGFTRPRREAAMRWLRRWLLHRDDAPTEADVPVATDEQLRVTRSGQVLLDFPGSKSVCDLNAERADELARRRAERSAGRPAEALRADVRKRLALPESPTAPLAEGHSRIDRDGYTIDTWAFATEPGVAVPVLLFRPDAPAEGRPWVVYVGADRALAAPGGEIERRLKAGEAVALVEPRGMGETAPGVPDPAKPGFFGTDAKEAFLSFHLARPLLGQRAYDLLQALRALEQPAGFTLIGVGNGGPIVLHAAALDDRIKGVEVERSVVSWSAVARGTIARDQLSSAVPGVLEDYDLPELATLIAPRPLTIRAALDAAGTPATQAALDVAYAPATAAYRDRQAAERLVLRAGP
jgi:dienelactone hydrolase